MKPPQALHNYHLFKPPLGQFDVISLDRGTKFYDNQLAIHASHTKQSFKKITHGPQTSKEKTLNFM
jgi:cytochrome c1